VSLLRSALGALGGALILRSTIRTLADFSQSMSTIKAITGETGAAFDALRNRAKKLGIETRFSATQAAEGMVFLARTGFDANQVLQTIQGTLNLAQVGLIDVARAADIASNVLKGFRLEANSMNRVIDVLAKTSSKSNTNVEQLGDAMSFAAPAAAALGVSVETTAAAIGVLSDAAIQGTRAGSGLRTSFIKLLAGAGAAKKSLKAVDLSLKDVNIESRGLIPVLETLRAANIGLTQAYELVGIRQANNLLILIDSLPRLKELARLNREAAGTAEEMAEVMDDNLNGALLRVKSAFEGVILELGDEGGTSGLRTLLEKTAQFLRIVANNADMLAKALTIMGTVILGRLVVGAIAILISQLKKLVVTMTLLSARIIPAMAAAAIAAFAILAAIAKANGEDIAETFEKMKEQIVGFFKDIVIPTDAIQGFSEEIGEIAGALKKATKNGKLTGDEFTAFIDTIEELKTRISDQLLITEFLAPGSEAVKTLTAHVENLDAALQRLRGVQAGKGLVVDDGSGRDPKALPPKLEELRQALIQEADLLKVSNREREIQQVLLDAKAAADDALQPAHKLLIENLARENQALRDQREVIEDILGPVQDYKHAIDALNGSMATAALSEKERTQAMRDARIAFLDQQTDLVSGIERSFLKMGRDSEDLASRIESVLTNAFRGAGDALAEFVTTGKLDFASLINSIISDLARLAIQGAIVNPLANLLGLGKTGIGDEDPTKGLQGLFNKFFGSEDTLPPAGSDPGGRGFSVDPALTAIGTAADTVTQALTNAAPAIENVTSAALPAATALGTDLVKGTLEAAIGTATETAATVTATTSLTTLAVAAEAAALSLQTIAASGGGGGFLESLFSLGGGAAPLTGAGSAGASAALLPLGPSFRHGGDFTVGGPGGIDRTLVQFKATRGEEVSVRTPEQARQEGGNITQIWNIESPDVGGFNRSRHQIMGQAGSGIAAARGRG
jgi:TP901 family phage tail tape measure protein